MSWKDEPQRVKLTWARANGEAIELIYANEERAKFCKSQFSKIEQRRITIERIEEEKEDRERVSDPKTLKSISAHIDIQKAEKEKLALDVLRAFQPTGDGLSIIDKAAALRAYYTAQDILT